MLRCLIVIFKKKGKDQIIFFLITFYIDLFFDIDLLLINLQK